MHSRWARKQIRRVLTLALTATVAIVGLVLPQPPRAELSVLCSNNSESCRAVADAFEERTNHRVHVVRLPTSEALARLQPDYLNVHASGGYDMMKAAVEAVCRSFRKAVLAGQSGPYEPWHMTTIKWAG